MQKQPAMEAIVFKAELAKLVEQAFRSLIDPKEVEAVLNAYKQYYSHFPEIVEAIDAVARANNLVLDLDADQLNHMAQGFTQELVRRAGNAYRYES